MYTSSKLSPQKVYIPMFKVIRVVVLSYYPHTIVGKLKATDLTGSVYV